MADETVVVPGHGPTTTIGYERRYNPMVHLMCKAQYVFIVIVFLLSLFSFGRSQAQTQDLQQPMLAAHNPVRKSAFIVVNLVE